MKKEVKATTKKQPNQYTVSKDGKAWISQTQAAIDCGLERTMVNRWIKKNALGLNLNEFNQLDDNSLCLLVDFALAKNSTQAIKFNAKLRQAGARAYIYGMSGNLPEQQNVLPFPTTEANKLIEGQRTAITNNRATNIKKRSDTLKYWVFLGWLKCELKYVKQYKYSITPLGLENLKRVKTTFFLKDET